MKRIKIMLIAFTMLLASPALFLSCQEDAPEINYTMEVSVINDFTKVVEAINNGALSNAEAIAKLTEAIDKMNTDQATKLQAIVDVLSSMNATIETKLAAIEAAMKAQTLSLESKFELLRTAVGNQTLKQEEMATKLATAIDNLSTAMGDKLDGLKQIIDSKGTTQAEKLAAIEAAIKAQTLAVGDKLALLETAIKALPDYTSQLTAIKKAVEELPNYGDKLSAIETAIKALPDYKEKFDAVVTSLGAIKAQIDSLGTSQAGIAEKIGEATAAISDLIEAVNAGNADAAEVLKQIGEKIDELKKAIVGDEWNEDEEYVDLGLPSGLKWATHNLGANSADGMGNLYAWGETEAKDEYLWSNYKWLESGQTTWNYINKYTVADQQRGIWYNSNQQFIGDSILVLQPEDDAATIHLGQEWRTPTKEEMEELVRNCTWKMTTSNNMFVYEVTGKNGKSIILPTGYYSIGDNDAPNINTNAFSSDYVYYMTSSLKETLSCYSLMLEATNENVTGVVASLRYSGLSVRPVHY